MQRFLNRPSSPQAHVNETAREAESFSPCADRHRFTIECQQAIARGIPVLFNACGPSAILRTVRAVIIDAVKAVIEGWSTTHIGEEGFEGITPVVADGNASASITRITASAPDIASGLHPHPNTIFRRLGVQASLSMCGFQSADVIASKTTAGLRVAFLQRRACGKNALSARTLALISDFAFSAFVSGLFDDGQTIEDLTGFYRYPSHVKTYYHRMAT